MSKVEVPTVQIQETPNGVDPVIERLDRMEVQLERFADAVEELVEKLNELEITAEYSNPGYSIES